MHAHLPDVRDSPVHPTADEMRWLYARVGAWEWMGSLMRWMRSVLVPVARGSINVWSWYGHDTARNQWQMTEGAKHADDPTTHLFDPQNPGWKSNG